MTDLELRQRLIQNPPVVLAEEFSAHRDRLLKIVDFRLKPALAKRIDHDDVLQEAWLAAVQRVKHFLQNETLSMFVWLRLIVLQTLVDIQRRHLQAKQRDSFRDRSINESSNAIVVKLLAADSSPSQAVMRNDRDRQLLEAIEGLHETDREVLAMRHFEDLTNTEVAQALGIQVTAASNRYVRALRHLKNTLANLADFSD